jgi:catechol 2,3-dioxygenase-like lactoylglutathione lyase family enzyme
MTVSLDTTVVHPFSIRVKQIADIELHVQSRIHFNTNVSDFPAAREFYGMLGFETLTGFPDTNTQAMARAIGVETPTDYDGAQGADAGGYLLHGELVGVNGFKGGVIDLIEFTVPRNDDPPYSKLNHLGMASATMATTNIEADYEYMIEQGVQFLSSPTTRSDGTVFAMFTDLDGSFYELVEVDGDDEETETTHITSLSDLNINVSDFERSRAWYQMFGYDVTNKLPTTESMEVAKAIGFEQEIELDGALLTHNADDSTIKLVQWIAPYDPELAYPLPVNHFGLHRTAFTSTDIEADVAMLKAQGVKFVSPITPCCSGPDSSSSIVAFYDPDGTIVELTEQPFLAQILFSIFLWVRDIFL